MAQPTIAAPRSQQYWKSTDNQYILSYYRGPTATEFTSMVLQLPEDVGKKYSNYLTNMGGRFNSRLEIGPGWIYFLNEKGDQNATLAVNAILTGQASVNAACPRGTVPPERVQVEKTPRPTPVPPIQPLDLIGQFSDMLREIKEETGQYFNTVRNQNYVFYWGTPTQIDAFEQQQIRDNPPNVYHTTTHFKIMFPGKAGIYMSWFKSCD